MTREHVECPTVAHCVRLENGQSERYMWHGVWAVTKKPTRLWLRRVWLLIEFVNSAWLHIVISGSAKVPSGYVEQNVMLLQLGPLQFDTGLFPLLMVNLSPFLNKPPLPGRAGSLDTWFNPTQIQMCRRKSTMADRSVFIYSHSASSVLFLWKVKCAHWETLWKGPENCAASRFRLFVP